ncbi:Formin binding protein 4 [Homalodisca vitripennis]|nr:Formin binding protein 4 [Homalodisca vitripennis]
MKRRGTSRRQVLDLDTKTSSSPKRSWQTKYQQICLDHKNSKGSSTIVAQNGADNQEKKLPQLVGYASDSESDEAKTTNQDLDAKVEDFLKFLKFRYALSMRPHF